MKGPLKSGGEEKIECFGKGVFSMLVSFREYSASKRRGDNSEKTTYYKRVEAGTPTLTHFVI